MQINIWAVLVSAIVAMVIGFLWYGPIMGKKYMELFMPNAKNKTPEEMAVAMKEANKLYIVQFILSFFQLWVLAWFIYVLADAGISSGIHTAFGVWVGFLMTTTAGGVLWTGDSKKVMWQKFIINAIPQLITLLIAGAIIAGWR